MVLTSAQIHEIHNCIDNLRDTAAKLYDYSCDLRKNKKTESYGHAFKLASDVIVMAMTDAGIIYDKLELDILDKELDELEKKDGD